MSQNTKKGFIALITVLTVSAIALLASGGILLRSVTESVNSGNEEFAQRAWAAVSGCSERALWQIATTTGGAPGWNYSGSQSFNIGGNLCYINSIITTSTPIADSRIIQSYSMVSGFTRKMQIVIASTTSTTTPPTVYSWREVGDF